VGSGLPRVGAEGVLAKLGVYTHWKAALEAVDPATIPRRDRVDIEGFRHHYELYRFLIEDLGRWRHQPDAVSPLGELFFVLLTSSWDSEEARFHDVLRRLEEVPAYLDVVRGNLTEVDSVWADTAERVCRGISGLWRSIALAARETTGGALAQEIAAASSRAAEAVTAYEAWLKDGGPRRTEGLWVLSDEHFDALVERKLLGLTVVEIRELGEHYLHEYRDRRAALARKLTSSGDVAEARKAATGEIPRSFDAALGQIRRLVAESRRFVLDRDLTPRLDREEMRVLRTPEFLVPLIPFAAMLEAGLFTPLQRSVYMVTPPADDDLSKLARTRFSGIAVHEGYPGHHLQHSYSHRHNSVYRNNPFCGFPMDGAGRFGLDLVEGWAHYTEEMMKDRGFHDSLESRFLMVEDQLFRAVRILIDVDLSRGRMTMQEAQDFLCSEVGMGRTGAEAEVRRYTTSPTYQLCYLVGKHKIEQFRDELRAQHGQDDRAFHEIILRGGCLPIEMIREDYLASLEEAAE
jgi:uncharacterized protein (DUF885 family)